MTDSVAQADRPIDTARLLRTLERCADMRPCCGDKFMGCEYRAIHGSDGCYRHLAHDVLTLLITQEPVEPTIGGDADGPCGNWWYQCGKCKEAIDYHDRYCRNCGQAVKWE